MEFDAFCHDPSLENNEKNILSAYALIISVTGTIKAVKWIRAGLTEHPLVKKVLGISTVERYLKETMFRAEISLYPGLFINLFYACIEMYHNIYELIISDIMMPEIDGFEFAETVRHVNKHIPILFMSAKDDLPSKQKGFQLGIDDYMVKPVELDADAMTATVDGAEIPVTTREFNIIYKLLSYPKKTFSRAQLMDEFWGDSETSLRAVDVYITKLRDKFSGCDGFEIKTVRGLGYPGFIGWIVPYFLYRHMAAQEEKKYNPLIEEKLDEIYLICEKGHSLL